MSACRVLVARGMSPIAFLVQDNSVLVAKSNCCDAQIYWRRDEDDKADAYCWHCDRSLKVQPEKKAASRWSISDRSPGFRLAYEVKEWAETWTGKEVVVTVK